MEPGSSGHRICRRFSQGLIHSFRMCSCGLADGSGPQGPLPQGACPLLLPQAPASEPRAARTSHRRSRKHERAHLISSAHSLEPAFPRPPTLGFAPPLPRKGCPSQLSPGTQIESGCLVTGLLEVSGIKHQAHASDRMAFWGSWLVWCPVRELIKGREVGRGLSLGRSGFGSGFWRQLCLEASLRQAAILPAQKWVWGALACFCHVTWAEKISGEAFSVNL